MGNLAAPPINQFNGAGNMQFNSRGSSHYGQQQNVHQISGQRALDDLYGANLPTSFNSNASTTSSQTSFDNGSNRTEHNNSRYESNHSNASNNQPNQQQQQQPPRRIISQQPSFLTNSNNSNNSNSSNNPKNQNINTSNNNKLNDMSSSSSNSSSLREDEQQQQQMNQRNQNYNNRNYSDDQRPNYNNQQNYRQNPQQNNYHDSRPHYNNQQNNNRYNNNYNNQQNNYNNNYQNRNNSGERIVNQMNNKMGNLNLRDNNPINQRSNERELPPRFQKMQQQQQQQQQHQQPQQPHRNYNQQQESYNNQRNQQNHHNYNNNNNQGIQYNNHQQQQYQQRNQNNYNNNNNNNNSNNFNNQQQMNNQPGNQITNQKINFNLLDSKEKEISLRPAKNFFQPKPPMNLGNPAGQQQRNDFNDQSPVNQPDNPLNRNQLNKPSTPIKQLEKSSPVAEPLVEQKEDYLNKVNESLGKLIKKEQEEDEIIKQIKELKTTKASKNQLLVHIMKYGLDKSEQERELITNIVAKFKKDDFCTTDDYKQAFKQILSAMRDLEADVPKIKSFVSIYIAHGISEEIIDLKEAFDLTVKTIYYPLFLLCLQYLGQNKDQQWLIKKFNESKLDLMLALPEIDRNKERLSEVLRDRQLGFLYPLLRIESELMKQVNSGNDISPKSLYSWIKENVDGELQKTEGFIITLFTCIAKYVTEKTKTQIEEIEKEEGSNTDKRIIQLQKDILSKYAQIFQSFLLEKQNLQLALLYALQAYCHKLQFPKGMIFRWFIMLYDLEIVDGEVFLIWKEEVNDEYPDKGKALFQVNSWLNWLEKAEQDDDDDDDE